MHDLPLYCNPHLQEASEAVVFHAVCVKLECCSNVGALHLLHRHHIAKGQHRVHLAHSDLTSWNVNADTSSIGECQRDGAILSGVASIGVD